VLARLDRCLTQNIVTDTLFLALAFCSGLYPPSLELKLGSSPPKLSGSNLPFQIPTPLWKGFVKCVDCSCEK